MNFKKIIFTIILTFILVIPVGVNAEEFTCTYSSSDGTLVVTVKNGKASGKFNDERIVIEGEMRDKTPGFEDGCPSKMAINDVSGALTAHTGEARLIDKFELNYEPTLSDNGNSNNDTTTTNSGDSDNYEFNEAEWDLCTNPAALKTFKFIGNILRVAFILIPILLIVMGSIDFMKATVASKEDDIKKAQSAFIKRVLAAVIVFFVPIITNIVLEIIPNTSSDISESNCLTCVVNPNTCNTN